MPSYLLRLGAILGATGVTLGAYGAHGLQKTLNKKFSIDKIDIKSNSSSELSLLEIKSSLNSEISTKIASWQTASWYQIIHAAVIVGLARTTPSAAIPASLMALGSIFFSGSIYAITFAKPPQSYVTMAKEAKDEQIVSTAETKLPKSVFLVTPIGGLIIIAGWTSLLFV